MFMCDSPSAKSPKPLMPQKALNPSNEKTLKFYIQGLATPYPAARTLEGSTLFCFGCPGVGSLGRYSATGLEP